MFLAWLGARLGEASTWGGVAAFFLALGSGLTAAGLPQAGAVTGAVGGGFSGVVAFIMKEKQP